MAKCSKCEITTNLVKHHISYSPETTEALCVKCHSKLTRRKIKGARFPIIRLFPTGVHFPKDLIEHLGGDIAEVYTLPLSPIAILFPLNFNLEQVKKSLEIVLKDIELRMEGQSGRSTKAGAPTET